MFEHMWNYDFQSYKHLQNQKSLQLKDIIVFKEKRSLLMQKLLHFNYKILGWRNSATGINIGIFMRIADVQFSPDLSKYGIKLLDETFAINSG